ncbi:carbohydrate ABC transporter permease [Aliivibrio kagoshimensis]|uniref:carbohydrate ABC transporter permease n=1 Tax=Aliivibrio kagoshimensis TaxID=2910230 RepID=UPI003D0BC6D0
MEQIETHPSADSRFTSASKHKVNKLIKSVILHLMMLLMALLWLAPIWLMLVFSSHDESAIYASPPPLGLGTEFINNFTNLNEKMDFVTAITNSVIVAGTFTFLSMILTSLAGYALARFSFKGKTVAFALIIGTLTIPMMAVVIPQCTLVARDLGMANSYIGVLLPYLANSLGVFFMRQMFLSLPQEVLDASRVDGASESRIFFEIALPMVRPGMAALAIILFLTAWNDYLWPLLILTDSTMFTAPVAMGTLLGIARVDWSMIMVGVVMMSLPFLLLFLILQRQLIAGITAGAVK